MGPKSARLKFAASLHLEIVIFGGGRGSNLIVSSSCKGIVGTYILHLVLIFFSTLLHFLFDFS